MDMSLMTREGPVKPLGISLLRGLCLEVLTLTHAAWSAAVLSDVPRKSFLSKAHCLRGTKIGEVPRKAASRVPSPLDLKSLMCTDPGSETCALLCDVAAGDEGWMKEPPTIQLQPQVVACYTCNQNQQ